MPRRELRYPSQVENWLQDWGGKIHEPAELVLIGSGGLLWHAAQAGIEIPLPENSMDVDPVTDSDEVAFLGYEAMIGSEFEKEHGWHVNLMPAQVLNEMPRLAGPRLPQKLRPSARGGSLYPRPPVSQVETRRAPRQIARRMGHATSMTPWGKYPNYRDIARFEYGRLLWKNPEARRRLLAHWESPDHPHAERFRENKSLVREILESPLGEAELDSSLRSRALSLRAAAREIPPVLGSI